MQSQLATYLSCIHDRYTKSIKKYFCIRTLLVISVHVDNSYSHLLHLIAYISQIEQKDIDFHEYYTNGKLDDLKYRMDRKLYPPRRKARVQAKHSSFFESSKTLDYCLTFSKKCITGKIIIPCHNIGTSNRIKC